MLRVGTRGSKLALAQTGHVIDALRELDPDLTIEPVVVESADSTIMDKSRYVIVDRAAAALARDRPCACTRRKTFPARTSRAC